MFNLPTPLLGNVTAITIASPDLEKSLAYYQRLGFKEVMRFDFPFPWIQVSDGALLLMLRKDATPYIALTYYVNDIKTIAAMLESKGIAFTSKPGAKDMVNRYVFQSPDGLNISLVDLMEGFKQPPGPTMLGMQQEDYFKPETYTNQTCGMYGELAQPVKDLATSIAFWELLGYKTLTKFEAPYNWAIMSDGLCVVGLHESTHFSYPAITFFASDMQEKIEKLQAAGLDNFTTHSQGNITLTTPEQQHVFLFSMGG